MYEYSRTRFIVIRLLAVGTLPGFHSRKSTTTFCYSISAFSRDGGEREDSERLTPLLLAQLCKRPLPAPLHTPSARGIPRVLLSLQARIQGRAHST
jgi:hypothetical protein